MQNTGCHRQDLETLSKEVDSMQPTVFIGVFLYFALALAVGALLLLPQRRWAERRSPLRHVRLAWPSWSRAFARALAGMRLSPWWMLAVLVFIVPAGFWALRQLNPLDTYDHRATRPSDPLIARLLQGEQLAAPDPLPPAMFLTEEVRRIRPLLATANREWGLLDPEFRQVLLVTLRVLQERHGIDAVLIEGFRTPERQAALHAMGPHVTHAGAGMSLHQRGLAADIAFVRDGRIVISERDPWAMQAYLRLGETAQELGLTWGGSWRTLRDYGHVEMRR